MKSWTHALGTWKSNWEEGCFRGQAQGNGHMRPGELRTIIEAKKAKSAELFKRYASETAIGVDWEDQGKRQEFFALKREIKDLNDKLASMA